MPHIKIPKLGIKTLDKQHMDIVLFLTQIKTTPVNNTAFREKITQYCNEHFEHEERFMLSFKYPEAERLHHILEHRRIAADLKITTSQDNVEFTSEQIDKFRVLFLTHVSIYDQMLADWVHRNRRVSHKKLFR